MGERPKCKTGSHQNPWGESRQKPLWSRPRNFLLNTSLEARETKAKMNYLDYIKIKSFCTAKEIIKTKRQPMEREKIFVNDISDKGLVSKIYKERIKFNTQKANNPVKKRAKTWIVTSPRKITRWPTNTWKKCSTSLIIRKIQMKTTIRYHLTPVRMAKINNSGNNRRWRTCGERGSLLHHWWECKQRSHSGKQYGGSSKN